MSTNDDDKPQPQGRGFYKCKFCDTILSSQTCKRHLTSTRECGHKLRQSGDTAAAVMKEMRRASQFYAQHQVVARGSLEDFAGACSRMPDFEGIPTQALVQFGHMLLEAHGTRVDPLNKTSSFLLKVPSTDPPATTPATRLHSVPQQPLSHSSPPMSMDTSDVHPPSPYCCPSDRSEGFSPTTDNFDGISTCSRDSFDGINPFRPPADELPEFEFSLPDEDFHEYAAMNLSYHDVDWFGIHLD